MVTPVFSVTPVTRLYDYNGWLIFRQILVYIIKLRFKLKVKKADV